MPRNQKNGADTSHHASQHQPVLLGKVLRVLHPSAGESYLDVTAGYGGHAQAVLQATGSPKRAVLIDRDGQAEHYLKDKFGGAGPKIIRADYLSASRELASRGAEFDMILADLGASSPHLNISERGFSFLRHGPLDMRMDQSQKLTAAALVNELPQSELEQIIRSYGEEPQAAAIAKGIVAARPLSNTGQLAQVVAKVAKKRFRGRRIHPATRSFQALRIAVNDELKQLRESLPLWEELLVPGGRLAIISFHSLEDRIVKSYFSEHAANTYDSAMRMLTKKPLGPSKLEIDFNPRARSAKLRAAVKIKTKIERIKETSDAN